MSNNAETPEFSTNKLGFSPLYLQVKQQLIEKMIAGDWPPGALLPSEQQLGAQMGVSQGTVRKALDALALERIVVRHQGRGTFVAKHDQNRTLFQFFKIVDENGERSFPETVFSNLSTRKATPLEQHHFGLGRGGRVWQLIRHRALNGETVLFEQISIPAEAFKDFDKKVPLPNNIYQLYERDYGITIARAVENLRAVACSPEIAEALRQTENTPTLQIDRIAYGLNGKVAEFRRTFCPTSKFYYTSELQ